MMRESFKSRPWVLSLNIIDGVIKNCSSDRRRYKLGVFTVTDTNTRILIVGTAIVCGITDNNLFECLKIFFEIHHKTP
jgi:hypothetical protein